ncbi:phospholipase A2 inhibitor and Ly6/PLAUR domain-containing protein-like [Anomaloglossus baeobatrachus]|uniref:phospholipase A2 inhibitor and Ly6/PLAUR domain-containing protein-like n=1 Tax=Anomaloglossus baeobatrachus TaxID=238106 RepID=UPI003F5001FC
MSSPISIFSLLSAFAATSFALSCTQCISGSPPCTGDSRTCPSGDMCGSEYVALSTGGDTKTTFDRRCTSSHFCNLKGSRTVKQEQYRVATSCCSTDNCTPTTPELPEQNSTPNGLVCTTCVSDNSAYCNSSDTIQCTGKENRCFLLITNITGKYPSLLAVRGCATKSFCDVGNISETVRDSSINLSFICTSGGSSVHKVLLTPAVVCLLLLKWFF